MLGHTDEAAAELERALEFDLLSPEVHFSRVGRYEEVGVGDGREDAPAATCG